MTPVRQIRVMIADDHAVVRRGLTALLNASGLFLVVGKAKNGREAVTLAKTSRPDVILMDVSMPLLNGLEATRQILSANPRAKVIMLSAHTDNEYLEHASASGAAGYLEKHSLSENLLQAIQKAAQGRTFSSPALLRVRPRGHRKPRFKTPDDAGENDVRLIIT